jgi:Phytanoyl-CoA dioxygenase (PhyH)
MSLNLVLNDQQRDTFARDGVRKAVAIQMGQLGNSPTGYDFEGIAEQIWQAKADLDVGAANRFDMSGMGALVLADPQARPLQEERTEQQGQFLYDVAAWKHSVEVRHVAMDSALPPLVADLLGAGYLNFWEDTTFVKTPGTRQKTAFHQDLAYFQIDGGQCVIVWIPLDPADQSNGTMEYVAGSHLWDEVYAPNVFVSQTPLAKSPEKRCPDIEGNRSAYDIRSFDVQPGDVIIHHVRTVHGAGGNPSSRMRRAMSLRYCDDGVRYYDRPGAIPQYGVAHDLADGDRLFSRDYPVVWPKPWPGLALAPLYPNTRPV